MTEHPPTRAEAREAVEQLHTAEATIAEHTGGAPVQGVVPITYTAELGGVTVTEAAPEFLPLSWRRVLYIAGLIGLAAAPIVAVELPAYADAIEATGYLLGVAALGTALANPPRR